MQTQDQSTGTTVVRLPAGLAGPDVTALKRILLAEVRRREVDRLVLDLSATSAVRRLAPLVLEVSRAAAEAGCAFQVDPPSHPAARALFGRRVGGSAGPRRKR